jgi:SWI/SNF related-matrix-associated actin-dependent regulator of chromatin subfamily C
MFSGDFVKLTSSPPGVSHSGTDDDWTDQEVLLLLEGIEMFDDDWSAIEDHVGTRTSQQCVRKFLALPIEDPYIASEGDTGPLRFGRIPFEQSDNPVMSVVAFLAGVVGSGVAAEAAKTAMHALTDGSPREGTENALDVKGETGDKKDAEGDTAMDEDAPDVSTAANAEPETNTLANTGGAEDVSADTAKPAKLQSKLPQSHVMRAAQLALKSSAKAAQNLADAEDVHIRSTLSSLIKLTLTKLELKTSQFEELEEVLEEERKGLESARMALVNERVNLKRMLDGVRSELAKNGRTSIPPTNLGTTGQGTIASEVSSSIPLEGDVGPRNDGEFAQLA